MKALTLRGQWWLPDSPRRKVGGTLHFDPSGRGLVLELLGSFEDDSVEQRLERILGGSAPKQYPLLHGSCVEEEAVTLYLPQEIGSSGQGPGTFAYQARAAFLGGRFPNVDAMEFSGLTLSLTHLSSLVPRPEIAPRRAPEAVSDPSRLRLEVGEMPELRLELSDRVVTFRRLLQESYDIDKGISLGFPARVEVEFASPKPLDETLRESVNPLQNLLTVLFDRPSAVEELLLRSPRITRERWGGDRSAQPLKTIYQAVYVSPEEPRAPTPIALEDLGHADEVLERWFAVSRRDDLGPVISALLSVCYVPFLFLENRFLNVIQALEGFHRRRFPDEDLPASEFEQRCDRILGAGLLPKDQRWLRGKFKRMNDRPLSKRIQDVVRRCQPVSRRLVGDQHVFAGRAEATRNHLSHLAGELEKRSASGEELLWMTTTLGYLLATTLLMEIGVETTERLMATNPAFTFAAAANSKYAWGPKS